MKVKNLCLIFAFSCFLGLLFPQKTEALARMESDNFRITWPNLNMIGGATTSPGYRMGVTGGQTAPGLYSSLGYKIRSGFQYIHSIIPFSLSLSEIALAFGSLTKEDLNNEKTLTLTVSSGSAGGYQILAQENDHLKSTVGSEIVDTSCDPADSCDYQNDAGTWTQNTTYGLGYSMSGTDVPTEFSGGKFKRFSNAANLPAETPTNVMGLTPAEGHEAEREKIAVMTVRINVGYLQPAGVYQNILYFTALPTY